MADSMSMPSGSGGLLRYNEEYPSKITISPQQAIVLIIAVVVIMTIIKIIT
jgi:preprotein translocase subunit Sec61beta